MMSDDVPRRDTVKEIETDGGVDVADVGNGRAPHYGDLVENWACDAFEMVYVDDKTHDAILDDGTRVQIKGAKVKIGNGYKNGVQQHCNGRLKFWEGDHQDLVENGGLYLLVIYTIDDDGQINVIESDWFEPGDVDDEIGDGWYSIDDPRERSKGRSYRTTWPSFFPDLEEGLDG